MSRIEVSQLSVDVKNAQCLLYNILRIPIEIKKKYHMYRVAIITSLCSGRVIAFY